MAGGIPEPERPWLARVYAGSAGEGRPRPEPLRAGATVWTASGARQSERSRAGDTVDESPTAELAVIAAAVIVSGGRVLLVRRTVAEGDLSWQFPAGKVEPGESPDEAAAREAHEETGLTVRAIRRVGERVHPMTGRTLVYVACELVAGIASVMDDREVAEVAWCDREVLAVRVPDGVFGPVQAYLDAVLV